ncbi:SRPBCC family protein [Agromyces aerolatus]|uniref:SRPBCC family protein n=1 Tax=Agromyces sp. LY-1074 TaxID=3074080 RepID=UPI00285AAF59|nr:MULTISPECIES: SRPBCC domain-containing protein [unclassified Agromyces]MDR5701120.1 SRPBCC domain-containing protein [Agromyces sp. LY-1074]MDR5707760.1 SRPBCC domain-containing protein [Agromyces sp. LY-1358]
MTEQTDQTAVTAAKLGAEAPQFTITRVFDAPRETVWRAWTDPDEAPFWMHPHGLTTPREQVELDVRPGGRYRYTMVTADGTAYPTAGTYLEVTEPSRLVFTWGSPDDADERMPVITVDLAEHGDAGRQTLQTFHLVGIAGAPGDDNVHDGWTEAFEELDAHLEGMSDGETEPR